MRARTETSSGCNAVTFFAPRTPAATCVLAFGLCGVGELALPELVAPGCELGGLRLVAGMTLRVVRAGNRVEVRLRVGALVDACAGGACWGWGFWCLWLGGDGSLTAGLP